MYIDHFERIFTGENIRYCKTKSDVQVFNKGMPIKHDNTALGNGQKKILVI